jgi:hypothetical protein
VSLPITSPNPASGIEDSASEFAGARRTNPQINPVN